jgi:hypothetical protein
VCTSCCERLGGWDLEPFKVSEGSCERLGGWVIEPYRVSGGCWRDGRKDISNKGVCARSWWR